MAGTTMASISGLLKEVYEPQIVSQLYDDAVGWKRITSSSEGVTERAGGKYVDFPIVVGRNQGISYRNEEEELGDPGRGQYSEVHVELKYGYGRGRLSGQTFELADGNPQAFTTAVDTEMDLLKDAIKRDQNRIFYGDGSGLITPVSTNMGGNGLSFVVTDPHFLQTEMDIDLLTMSNGTALAGGTNRTISAINRTTKTVTVEADSLPFNATTTEGVYRRGNYEREPEGLASIVDDTGILYGVDPSSVDEWRAVDINHGGSISESVMVRMCDEIYQRGGKVSAIFTTLGVRTAYWELLQQQRRFTDDKEFNGGLVGTPFNYAGRQIPIVADPDLRPGVSGDLMYFLQEDVFKFYHTGDWKFIDRDGSMFRMVKGFDSYEFVMRRYWQLGIKRRNVNGVIRGVTSAY